MPPDIDIYVISGSRDRDTIERFITAYVDREANENCGDKDLMIFPPDATDDSAEIVQFNWEPAITLTHVINRGLDYPRRAFTVYLKPRDKAIDRAILAFTADNKVVFGLSIDDAYETPENVSIAKQLLHTLAASFNGHLGVVASESPPPLWEKDVESMLGKIIIWKKQS